MLIELTKHSLRKDIRHTCEPLGVADGRPHVTPTGGADASVTRLGMVRFARFAVMTASPLAN